MRENVFGLARVFLLELYIMVCDLYLLQVPRVAKNSGGCLYEFAL